MVLRIVQFLATGIALGATAAAGFAACTPSSSTNGADLGALAAATEARAAERGRERPPCPEGMAFVERTYCIDRWEASLVLVTPDGERPFSPYIAMTDSRVRAVSRPAVVPQAYVSRDDATIACAAAGKRLCKSDEWVLACRGSHSKKFPYGNTRKQGVCNDTARTSPLKTLFSGRGAKMFSFQPMNDPRLNTLPGTLEKTGSHPDCVSEYGVYDMVGNLHEWVDEPTSAFRGGYYLDTHENGDGCDYKTVAHGPGYHDYSTGFRCCADIQN